MGQMIEVGGIPVYEVKPEGTCRGGLIVIHEVWGLADHTKDVAERFAAEGYHVLAPNLMTNTDIEKHLTPEVGIDYFNPEKRNEVQPLLRQYMAPLQSPEFAAQTLDRTRQCFDYLYKQEDTSENVAVLGYCFGGSYSFSLAIAEPRLKAAVPYYGHAQQPVEELRKIACPILAFYGEKDENLMKQLPELTEKMHEASIDFTAQVYDNAGHAFFNDTNPFAYNEAAAKDAWQRTLDFLAINFKSS